MKLLWVFLVFCGAACFVAVPESAEAADLNPARYFNFYGTADLSVFPPHNETDFNLRGFSEHWNGSGRSYQHFGRAYGRYAIEADINIEWKKFDKVFVFVKPYFAFCDTIPAGEYYGWQPNLKLIRRWYGIGWHVSNSFDLLVQTHDWIFLGDTRRARIRDGPFGGWSGITVRYHFDTRK